MHWRIRSELEEGLDNMASTRIGGSPRAGTLYVVATPIGNLGDMVPRAQEILQTVQAIVAEDTRHSKKLLQHFGIQTPLQSFHDHSSAHEAQAIIKRLLAGDSIAIITDAGTPLVSDPGYPLVKLAHDHAIRVVPIPGACAMTAALCAAGLPADHVWFEGFLPAKLTARQQRLAELKSLAGTLVFYEAPHRIVELFDDLLHIYGGERECCMAREITKQFETIRRGSIADVRAFIAADPDQQRGEFVVIVAPESREVTSGLDDEALRVLKILLEELSVKQASALAAKITGKPKRTLYDAALGKNQ